MQVIGYMFVQRVISMLLLSVVEMIIIIIYIEILFSERIERVPLSLRLRRQRLAAEARERESAV